MVTIHTATLGALKQQKYRNRERIKNMPKAKQKMPEIVSKLIVESIEEVEFLINRAMTWDEINHYMNNLKVRVFEQKGLDATTREID